MPTKTPFAGYERLAPGDPLSSDGYAFQFENPAIADRLGQIGAVTHKHDAHNAMSNPTEAATITLTSSGGSIPANTPVFVAYTLTDSQGGETLPLTADAITTNVGFTVPTAPTATINYTTGALLAGDYYYAITTIDGAGGETSLGDPTLVTVNPGHATGEVVLSGLNALTTSSSSAATGWRMWRSIDGGTTWDLMGTGSTATDTFTDAGSSAGDCTVSPPFQSTTAGTNLLSVTVPSAMQPTGVTFFSIYADTTGQFLTPCLLGVFPAADFDAAQTFTDLNSAFEGQPPAVSQAYPGANRINPDTDIVNWYWKAPVANATLLPSTGNNDGDARVTQDTDLIWIWNATSAIWIQWNPAGNVVPSSQQPGNYTLALTDSGSVVEFTSASAVTLTIAAHTTVALPIGCIIEVFQYGAGQVTVAAGAGVTLRSDGAKVHTAAQYATISLRQRATDEWVLSGDLI